MRVVRLAALLALAVALYSQPKDVQGWDKIRWSMTMAEVGSTYGVEAKPESKDNWTLLDLHPVKMGDVKLGVQVGASQGSDKVTLVRLWSTFGMASSAPSAGQQDFDTLRGLLIQKYGHPDNEETQRGENFRSIKTVVWKFQSTSILLSLEQSSSIPNIGNIYLDYTAAGR